MALLVGARRIVVTPKRLGTARGAALGEEKTRKATDDRLRCIRASNADNRLKAIHII